MGSSSSKGSSFGDRVVESGLWFSEAKELHKSLPRTLEMELNMTLSTAMLCVMDAQIHCPEALDRLADLMEGGRVFQHVSQITDHNELWAYTRELDYMSDYLTEAVEKKKAE
ncbi:hypothetical protein EON81_04770 [bacterium]|nr:MAG: hypothetical protein EON81_04770 [bacterium]